MIINPYIMLADYVSSMYFDGVDEIINCGNVSMIQSATAVSLSCWVSVDTLTGVEYFLGRVVGINDKFYLAKEQTTGRVFVHVGTGASNGTVRSSIGLTAGSYVHVVVTYSSGTVKIYFDGSDVTSTVSGTIPSSLPSGTDDWTIGALDTSNNLAGYMFDVAIFDYVLSSTNVTDIYNSGTWIDLADVGGLTQPVHHWRMGLGATWDGTDWTVPDDGTTGGNDGTSTNMEFADRTTNIP